MRSFNLSFSVFLGFSPSAHLSPPQAGSCHESLTALSSDKWLFKYEAIQRTPFSTHRCFLSPPPGFSRSHACVRYCTQTPTYTQMYSRKHTGHNITHRTPARVRSTCQCHWGHADVWLPFEGTRGPEEKWQTAVIYKFSIFKCQLLQWVLMLKEPSSYVCNN